MIGDEWGQPVLPGFEVEFPFKPYRGTGDGQTSSRSDDWFTHPEIVDRVRKLYDGEIDLDPFSCAKANELIQAKTYYTAEQDGMIQPFSGKMLVNPPWHGSDVTSVKSRMIKKIIDSYNRQEVEQCVCVLNANALTTKWIEPLLDYPVCVPNHRIPHYSPDGGGGSPNSGTILFYVGPFVWSFSECFKDLGRILVSLDWAEWA